MNRTAIERELRIFKAFADVAPLGIEIESIESKHPPEPDIFCQSRVSGALAFELVELVDQGFAKDVAVLVKTTGLLRELTEELPISLRDTLRERFSDPNIALSFKEAVPLRDRKRLALEGIERHCKNVLEGKDPEDFVHDAFDSVRFYPSAKGLTLWASSGQVVSDPSLTLIRKKFGKRYASHHPIQLLAYVEIDLRLPEQRWFPSVDEYVRQHIAGSQFQRVWVFNAKKKQIDLVYPE